MNDKDVWINPEDKVKFEKYQRRHRMKLLTQWRWNFLQGIKKIRGDKHE